MKYLDKEHETAMQFYNEGYNDRMIAEAMYVSPNVVFVWRKRNGLERSYFSRKRKTNKTPENIEKIRKLKKLGKTDQEIGRLLGIDQQTVFLYRKQEGIETLPKQGIKWCKACNESFPATLEYFYSRNPGPLDYKCKTCRKAYAKRYYQKRKERRD